MIDGSLPSVEVMDRAHRQTITNATFRSMMAEQMKGGNVSLLFKYGHTCVNMLRLFMTE